MRGLKLLFWGGLLAFVGLLGACADPEPPLRVTKSRIDAQADLPAPSDQASRPQEQAVVDLAAGECTPQEGRPVICQVEPLRNGQPVTLRGLALGSKASAAPWRASYLHPQEHQAFQATGSFTDSPWSATETVTLHQAPDWARVKDEHHRHYAQLEYSSRGNYGQVGYSGGIRTGLPQTGKDYLAFWDYFEPDFDATLMETGAANFKWVYLAPGHDPHRGIEVTDGGSCLSGRVHGGFAGETLEACDPDLSCPVYGCYWYSRCNSWRGQYPLPRGRWFFVEIFYEINTDSGVHDGWHELRIDNEVIWSARNVDVFQDADHEPDFVNVTFGGNYGWLGEPYPEQIQYRRYGDFYIDGSFARVVLCESDSYDRCRHLELQIPTAWSAEAITFIANRGSFSPGQQAYLYVFDQDNVASQGFPVELR